MKRLLRAVTQTLADAALLESGVAVARPAADAGDVHETLEENLMEVAFAEAADFDDIHLAILREHLMAWDVVHPDDCQYGDNDACFA